MATIKSLTAETMSEMNEIIRPKFGPHMQITHGSYEIRNGAITRYYLVVGDPTNDVSQANLQRIGETLKDCWDSGAEYYSGTQKIA